MLSNKIKAQIEEMCNRYFSSPRSYYCVTVARKGHPVYDGGLAVIMYVDFTDGKTYAEVRNDVRYNWHSEYVGERLTEIEMLGGIEDGTVSRVELEADEHCFNRRNVKSLDDFCIYVVHEFSMEYSEKVLDELEVTVDKVDVEVFKMGDKWVTAC